MSTTTLRARTTPESRVDASALLPAALAGLAVADVERLTLPAGNDAYRVGDLFDVSRTDAAAGSEAGPTLAIEAAGAWLDRLGARMETGRLIVRGAAGDYAGLRMTGGTLAIEGDAGGFAGCEMRGGRLDVAGNCGDFAAGALPGDMEGMTGGTLTIRGHAGARLADRMRRGLVLVGGDAGPLAAAPRGAGRGFEVFWALLARSLADEIEPFSSWRTPPRARLTGDLAVDGRGEILIAG